MNLLTTPIANSGLLAAPLPSADTAILFGVKTLFIFAGVLYLLFAILVTRQINIMSKTIKTTAVPQIRLLGWIHLLVSLLVLIYFFIVL